MRSEPVLTVVPLTAVASLAELYAIAVSQAETAAKRFEQLAATADRPPRPVQVVFENLARRERERVRSITVSSLASRDKHPDSIDLRWPPTDLVPLQELTDVGNSSLTTPYDAWALAVRHRERAFVFWTYVAALATDPAVRPAAEDFARMALRDGNQLRRERRLAWRSMRETGGEGDEPGSEPESAALLESLLLKDIMLWSQHLAPRERAVLSTLGPSPLPPASEPHDGIAQAGTRDEVTRRALRRAELLSNLYLADADRAPDQASMELAQKLAAQAIVRLAGLRKLAAIPGLAA